jgi:hypothetical protein
LAFHIWAPFMTKWPPRRVATSSLLAAFDESEDWFPYLDEVCFL